MALWKRDEQKRYKLNRDVTRGNSPEIVKEGTLVWLQAITKHPGDTEPRALVTIHKTKHGFVVPLSAINFMPVGVNHR